MIRKMTPADKEYYLKFTDDFHHSDAVLAPIDTACYERTFQSVISGSPYVEGFIFERDGKVIGHSIVAFSFSTEVGGECLWIEEIYILPQYRGLGTGKEFFAFLFETYKDRIRRFRLEVEEENEGAVRLYKSLGFKFLAYDQMIKDI